MSASRKRAPAGRAVDARGERAQPSRAAHAKGKRAPSSRSAKAKDTTTGRRRLSRAERRAQIVDGAIRLFAEHGFDASTHQLADLLGVTQPLIYSYFPNKEELIEEVYEEVFVNRWNPEWETILADRDVPLQTRLETFYHRYSAVIHSTDWIRLYLQSGLRTLKINKRYTPIVEKLVIERICIELRHANGLPDPETFPITGDEMETVWTLHGGIFYYGVRKYVYCVTVSADYESVVRNGVATLLEGMPGLVRRLIEASDATPKPVRTRRRA